MSPRSCMLSTRGICPVGIWSLVSWRTTSWNLIHLQLRRFRTRSPWLWFRLQTGLVQLFKGVKVRFVIYL